MDCGTERVAAHRVGVHRTYDTLGPGERLFRKYLIHITVILLRYYSLNCVKYPWTATEMGLDDEKVRYPASPTDDVECEWDRQAGVDEQQWQLYPQGDG